MRIWHIGAEHSPELVDGVNNTVWILAKYQATLGHEISMVLTRKPDTVSYDFANEFGFKLTYIKSGLMGLFPMELNQILKVESPEIVQMTGMWGNRGRTQAVLAKWLVKRNIPYIIKPAGGLSAQLLRHGRLLKNIFVKTFIERPKYYCSSAIVTGTPNEKKEVLAFIPEYKGKIKWIPNPIEFENYEEYNWKGNVQGKQIVFLGRFDVYHKGLDILVEIAHLLPHFKFDLYGNEDNDVFNKEKQLVLRENLPPNMQLHKPVFGKEKANVLQNASLHIQMSRWEGIARSVCEAMLLGLPCAISEDTGLYGLFRDKNIAIPLPLKPKAASIILSELFSQPDRLKSCSQRGQEFAKKHFLTKEVVSKYLNLYCELVKKHHK